MYARITDYGKNDCVRFHMPGHKGRGEILKDAYLADITELSFSDNLNYPKDVIKNAEKYASELFSSKDTIFTVNGSTAGLMSAIMYFVKQGEKLLLPYDSHISCYYGAMHAGCEVVRCGVSDNVTGASLEDVKKTIEKERGIKACVLTTPTYFGFGIDIKSIVSYLHENNIAVIADESHGAHFTFSDGYPMSALEAGADIVIHSAHKSIGALTQTALVHINNANIKSEDIRFYLRSVQSTSPSYVLICSVIDAIEKLKNANQVLENVRLWYNNILEIISKLDNIKMLVGNNADYMKICVEVCANVNEFVQILTEKYHIVPEMVYDNKVVFMSGLYSEKTDYDRLSEALCEIDKMLSTSKMIKKTGKLPQTKSVMTIKQASDKPSEELSLNNSMGRISSSFVNVYPPGAPCLVPGEIITEEIIEYINNSDNVEGISNGKIKAVKKYEW